MVTDAKHSMLEPIVKLAGKGIGLTRDPTVEGTRSVHLDSASDRGWRPRPWSIEDKRQAAKIDQRNARKLHE